MRMRVESFNDHDIRIFASVSKDVFYSVNDASDALGLDGRELMLVVIESDHSISKVEYNKGNVAVVDHKFLAELALKAPEIVSREFIKWMVYIERSTALSPSQAIQTTYEIPQQTINKNPTKFATTQIAKEFGMSANQLNEILYNKGIQYRVNGQWVLTYHYQNLGYMITANVHYNSKSTEDEKVNCHSYWTIEGRNFIKNLLIKSGYTQNMQIDMMI